MNGRVLVLPRGVVYRPMLRLGALTLDAPFFQAGLAGYSEVKNVFYATED